MEDMAKQNKALCFAYKIPKNKEQKKKIKTKKNRKKRNSNWNKVVWVVPFLASIGLVFYGVYLYCWSKEIGKDDVYLRFLSENMINAVLLIVEVLLFLGGIVCIIFRKNIWACIQITIVVIIIIYIFFSAQINVAASIAEDRNNKISKEISTVTLDYVQEGPMYQLQQYILEEDIFMEKLGAYCGIPDNTIKQEERPEKMANILKQYLKGSVVDLSDKTIPLSYDKNVLMANLLYEDFEKWKKRSKKSENGGIKSEIYEYTRISLQDAIGHRIEAEKDYQTAENRRLLGRYYIDLGVCEQNISEIDMAADHYEDAAEWAVKSIVSAAFTDNIQAMKDGWEVLNDACDYLANLEQSDDGFRVEKIRTSRDAYKIVIEHW